MTSAIAYSILAVCVVAAILIVASIFHGAGLLIFISRLFPSTKEGIFREDREVGYSSHPDYTDLVGKEGVMLTVARPSGKARFGEREVPVICDTGFLDRGSPVKAVGIREGNVLVAGRIKD